MKIDIIPIIKDHIETLRDDRSGRYSFNDFALFYGAPLVGGASIAYSSIKFDSNFYNVSITFFGIFIALLLNVQVAVFGIFQRKWEKPEDENLAEIQKSKLEQRRSLLGELNSNLSYLILISCFSLVTFLVFFVFPFRGSFSSVISCVLYGHFVLTLMMSVKRAHTLFQMEYEGHC